MKRDRLKNRVRFYRTKKGLTQIQLATLCHTSKNTISAIECGLFSPTAYLAYKLCLFLDVDFKDLFYMEDSQ